METRLAGNFINDCAQGGIVALGFVPAGYSLDIDGNELRANGPGIIVGTDGARITANSISGIALRAGGDGIVLTAGLDKSGIDQCHVLGNRVTVMGGIGISILGVVKSAMIKNNFIDGARFGGIVMDEKSSAEVLSIENNQVRNIAALANDDRATVIGCAPGRREKWRGGQ